MLSPNTILRDRYRIIHQLGHGGMGAVYQAMDENLSCVVAVKETFAVTDEQRQAFRREAQLLANLTHPTLPRVMDHFTHGEGQFLVMQFVPGHDLAELLELREQPFSLAKVLGWADQLLDALEELHSSDPPIIHRDIKPANLKVTPKGKVLLLDFGLAKGFVGQMSTADAESHGKSIYGYTPHYAPLEQIRGAGTDARSDLYSLAATLWTLLTGNVPPDALSRVAEKEDGSADPLRSAHEINPEVPVPVSNLLAWAMALNRNKRPETASELRNGLRDAAQVEFESATLPLPGASAPEPTSLPPSLPPLEPTIKAPESASKNSAPDPQSVPTMRVPSPPAEPSWEGGGVSPTADPISISTPAATPSDVPYSSCEPAIANVISPSAGATAPTVWLSRKKVLTAVTATIVIIGVILLSLWPPGGSVWTAHGHDKLGDVYFDQRRYPEAIEQYKKAIKLDPTYATAYNHLGRSYHAQQRYSEAIEQYKKAIELNPGGAYLYGNLGNAYFYQQLYAEAIEPYKKAIELDPKGSGYLYGNLGDAYFNGKRYAEAIEPYKKAIELDPENADYTKLGDAYFNGKRYAEAIEPYKKEVELDPENANAYNKLGDAYFNQRRYAKAIEQYAKAIELDPENADAYNKLGDTYFDQQLYLRAIEKYRKAVELDPWNEATLYNLGVAYLNSNNKTAAMEQYESLKNLDSGEADRLLSEIKKH